jgi:D-beta-D-heptose 7-phosphate kinase/D-beta-D-heptose 1-phosphate adenosyltransferase
MTKISKKRFEELSQAWKGVEILVLGDVVLDKYIWGKVERLSPEAPVPVVAVGSETAVLGGAGNVAANIVSLGGKAHIISVRGDDEEGKTLERLLSENVIKHSLLVDKTRPTTTKLRVIGHNQQIVRIDKEVSAPISLSHANKIQALYTRAVTNTAGTIIEDYDKGVVTEENLRAIMKIAQKRKQKVFIDPKNSHWKWFAGAELVKPNQKETEHITGIKLLNKESVLKAGKALLKLTKAKTIAITRGGEGMTLFGASGTTFIPQTTKRNVADPTGAGDTVIATLALARSAGATWEEAALMANTAAAVVVSKAGTSTISLQELSENFL